MGHPTIDNLTPFAFEALFSSDEDGRPLLVPLIHATYSFAGADGQLALVEPQPAIAVEGEMWLLAENHGTARDPARQRSYKLEPHFAFAKLSTDVVLIGHARAPRVGTTVLDVVLRAGPLEKTVRVFGDRVWHRAMGRIGASAPAPFDSVPLCYERAFGGWDRSAPAPAAHRLELRNPVGLGFRLDGSRFEDGILLPNLEDPNDLLERLGQAVAPACFGFVSPNWHPRASLAGTYDTVWARERMPLLPADFDRRFFNAGSRGLVASGYFVGNESVAIIHATARGHASFRLPSIDPPSCRIELSRGEDATVDTNLDTVVIDADSEQVRLLFRGHLALRDGPHDVRSIEIRSGSESRCEVAGIERAPSRRREGETWVA